LRDPAARPRSISNRAASKAEPAKTSLLLKSSALLRIAAATLEGTKNTRSASARAAVASVPGMSRPIVSVRESFRRSLPSSFQTSVAFGEALFKP